jgi:hypothetical protein
MFIPRHLSWRRSGIGCVLCFRTWFNIYMTLSMCVLRATRYLHWRRVWCYVDPGTGGAVAFGWNGLRQVWRLSLTSPFYVVLLRGVCIAAQSGATLCFEPEAFLDERTLVLLRGVQPLFKICACLGVALALEAFVAFESG